MAPIELYPFRFRDPRTGKWVRARYVATLPEIEARYREWEILGPADVRADAPVQMFQPAPARPAERPPEFQPHFLMSPAIDATERFLLCLFLRRYIAWCARRRRFAAMQGAQPLLAEC